MLKQTNLKIVVVSENFWGDALGDSGPHGFALGTYIARFNNIFISVQVSHLGERHLKYVLLNELHHALVAVRNFLYVQKNILLGPQDESADTALFPFLNKDAEVDPRLLRRLTRAHEEFLNNDKKFIDLYEKKESGKTLNADESLWFDKAAHLIMEYYSTSPGSFFLMSKRIYQDARSLGYTQDYADGSVRLSKEIFAGEKQFKHDVRAYIFEESDEGMISMAYTYELPNEPKIRILSFVENMKTTEKKYKAGTSYAKKKENLKAAEFSSDMEPTDPRIKNFFSPMWCKVQEEYHKVNKVRGEYCHTPPNDVETTNERKNPQTYSREV